MGVKTYGFPFRGVSGFANNINNMSDGVEPSFSTAYEAAWTPGTTLIDTAPALPTIGDKWKILGVSGVAQLAISGTTTAGFYGKLGKIMFGFAAEGASATPGNLGVSPVQYLPTDSTLITALWDAANDPLPPEYTDTATTSGVKLMATGNVMLPVPLKMYQGTPIAIGLWQLPSLIGCSKAGGTFNFPVFNASYALIIDDGRN